jgi:VWFA-related protein
MHSHIAVVEARPRPIATLPVTTVIGFTAIAAIATLGPLHAQERSLATVMARVGRYTITFQQQFSNVVAEEQYEQDITHINLPPNRFLPETHRELRSDVLLVQPRGADRYVEFRDVFEVNGKPVRDRQDRLTALFLDPASSAVAQIERINAESARYNLGNIERTINTPTLALLFVLPQNQPRFRFTRSAKNAPALAGRSAAPRGNDSAAAMPAADAWVVEYEEVLRPTLIRTTRGLDLPAHGRFWVEAGTGRVLMTELITDEPSVRATIDVSYQADPRTALLAPAEMRERYEARRDGAVIEGVATYGRIRQFQVRTNQRLATGTDPASATVPAPANEPIAAPEPSRVEPPAPTSVAAPESQSVAPVVPLAEQHQPKPPTFTAGTELVLVDFVVTDKADRPVRGLSIKDFTVKEDGKTRPIVSFDAFGGDTPGAAAGAAARESTARNAPPPPTATTVLLVDDGQLSPEQTARLRPALKSLLAKLGDASGSMNVVAPGSRVSVLGRPPAGAADLAAAVDGIVGQRIESVSNFPMDDPEALAIFRGDLQVLARVAGRFKALNPELNADQAVDLARERANEVAHDARARRDVMYRATSAGLDWLATRPGRHSLVIVSAGFAQDPDDAGYVEIVKRSVRANAPIHFLDARGLPGIGRYQDAANSTALSRHADEGPFGRWDAASGSAALADETGGLTIGNMNDMEKGLGRLLDTVTTYYVIAYQPAEQPKPGYRTISVDVRGKGLHVRARRGYFSGEPVAR